MSPETSIALIYTSLGLLWISFSDRLLAQFQTLKGFAYVLVTGSLLYVLVRSFTRSLRQQQAYYRLLFEQNPLPMWLCDPVTGQIRESNQAACRAYGYTSEEFAERRLGQLEAHSTDQAFRAWQSGQNQLALQHQGALGQLLEIELQFHETPEGLLVVAYDLQEHKALEQRLNSANASLTHFQQTIHSATVMAVMDAQSKIQEASASLTQLSGLSQQEILGRRLAGICRSLQPDWPSLLQGLDTGRACRGELALAQGWVSFLLVRYQDTQGERYLLLGQEVTAQKKLQEELQALSQRLVEQNRDLQQFAQMISHQLRPPVANLLGLSELLRDASAEEARVLPAKIQLSVEQIDQRLKDLNQLVQVRGHSQLVRSWVDLTPLLSRLVSEYSDPFIAMDWQQDLQVSCVYAVPSYLESIFAHLISHALKNRDPQRTLQLRISSRSEPGKVLLEVQDNGLGMDMRQGAEQIFAPQPVEPGKEGQGLGLYLVRSQVEMLGGDITVQSTPQQGSCFRIRLPQPEVRAYPPADSATESAAGA